MCQNPFFLEWDATEKFNCLPSLKLETMIATMRWQKASGLRHCMWRIINENHKIQGLLICKNAWMWKTWRKQMFNLTEFGWRFGQSLLNWFSSNLFYSLSLQKNLWYIDGIEPAVSQLCLQVPTLKKLLVYFIFCIKFWALIFSPPSVPLNAFWY